MNSSTTASCQDEDPGNSYFVEQTSEMTSWDGHSELSAPTTQREMYMMMAQLSHLERGMANLKAQLQNEVSARKAAVADLNIC